MHRIISFSIAALLVSFGGAALAQEADDDLISLMFRGIDQRSYVHADKLWPLRQISVCWEELAESSSSDRELVRKAIAESWEAHSCLKFTGWKECTSSNKGIRIRVADSGPHTLGLGTSLDGKASGMLLNFTFSNWRPSCATSELARINCTYSIAVHEFGHALGFAHEHNRPDTPGECTKAPQGSNGTEILTPWDKHSVMNYCNPVYNNDGQLSFWDKYSIKHYYCT